MVGHGDVELRTLGPPAVERANTPTRERGAPERRPAPESAPRWLTMADFCNELGVAASTAYKWSASGTHTGGFPRFRRLPNGSIRIRRDWLEDWLEHLVSL